MNQLVIDSHLSVHSYATKMQRLDCEWVYGNDMLLSITCSQYCFITGQVAGPIAMLHYV